MKLNRVEFGVRVHHQYAPEMVPAPVTTLFEIDHHSPVQLPQAPVRFNWYR